MSEKRYKFGILKGTTQAYIKDCKTCKSATIEIYDDNIKYFVDKLNEQQATIQSLKEENRKLRNIHLSIDLTYNQGYEKYLVDVRVIDNE